MIPSSDREAAYEHRGELYQEKAAAGDKSQIRDIDTQTLGFPALSRTKRETRTGHPGCINAVPGSPTGPLAHPANLRHNNYLSYSRRVGLGRLSRYLLSEEQEKRKTERKQVQC